ncbi:MAG: hypothetical protein IKW33_00585 [Clostridia bacterium]|nr:hypothetical protein [Clostridia bacterium]
MIKLETHCHCKGGSPCGQTPPKKLVEEYKNAGYGGIVLTNHSNEKSYNTYEGTTHKEKINFFFSLYEEFEKECVKNGLKAFYGIEVGTTDNNEFMLYGFNKAFLYDNKPLFYYNQKELFAFAEKHNLFMYQTHPFRDGISLGNPKLMHGAESFNGHYNHFNHNEKAKEFCEKNKLIKISGTDYHIVDEIKTGGIYIPENVTDVFELTNYIFNNKVQIFENEEVYKTNLLRVKNKG